MDKIEQIKLINLQFIRLKVIITELVLSSNKELNSEELVILVDNLDKVISKSINITTNLKECKKRAASALKASNNRRDKEQILADPDFNELQSKLDILYKKAMDARNSKNKKIQNND